MTEPSQHFNPSRAPLLGLSEAIFASVRPMPVERVLPAGVLIEEQGLVPETLHFLLDGTVQMFADLSGRISTVDLMDAPDVVCLAAVVAEGPALASYMTMSRCRLLAVNAQAARDLLGRDGAFAAAMARQLAVQARRRIRSLHNQKLRTGLERLASWVVVKWVEAGQAPVFRRPIKKQVLASLLGLTPESLSRCCGQLEDHGASLDGSEIRITDLPRLLKLATTNDLIDGVSVDGLQV